MSASTSPESGYLIAGQQVRRTFLFRLSKPGVVALSVYTVIAILLLIFVWRTFVGLGVMTGGAVLLYVVLRVGQRADSRTVVERVVEAARKRMTRWRGWDAFEPSKHLPVPRPVGDVLAMGVSRAPGDPEQGVIRHSPTGWKGAYFTTTVEIAGRGDGLLTPETHARQADQVGMMLTKLAEEGIPVDELSIMLRAIPGLPEGYRDAIQENTSPSVVGSHLADNTAKLCDILGLISDNYRTFATISIPEDRLSAMVARNGPADREGLCQGVYSVLGRVVDLLDQAGFPVVAGLGPRRLGALIRHLYAPSWAIDDLTGIERTRDGFLPYPAPESEALRVPDAQHDVLWHHATAHIPSDGWPAAPIHSSRWMGPLVYDVYGDDEPSVIRTVTTSWRLVAREAARVQGQQNLLTDASEMAAEEGKVSVGQWDRQASASRLLLDDLLDNAAGVKPSVRVTCSSPSMPDLHAARDLVEASASTMNLDRLVWADGRQADAMLWSLPLGRGLARTGRV